MNLGQLGCRGQDEVKGITNHHHKKTTTTRLDLKNNDEGRKILKVT